MLLRFKVYIIPPLSGVNICLMHLWSQQILTANIKNNVKTNFDKSDEHYD